MMTHTFNPNTWETCAFNLRTREVETGRDMAKQRENIGLEETGAGGIQSEDL